MKAPTKVTIELNEKQMVYLEALRQTCDISFDTVEGLLKYWVSTLCDGIRRPGAWERDLLPPAFGDIDGLYDLLETNEVGQLTTTWKKKEPEQ